MRTPEQIHKMVLENKKEQRELEARYQIMRENTIRERNAGNAFQIRLAFAKKESYDKHERRIELIWLVSTFLFLCLIGWFLR